MGRKLDQVLGRYRVLIVHPIAVETHLNREGAKTRRSPKRNDIYGLFDELVSFPTLLDHPHLAIEVVLVSIDKHQHHDPAMRRKRGGWRTHDRRLRHVQSRHRFDTIDDLRALIPAELPPVFTTSDLASAAVTRRDRAQKMAYCLRQIGLFEVVDRTRSGFRYRLG
jgi:hypothetical protein